jgi:hypothetical protein
MLKQKSSVVDLKPLERLPGQAIHALQVETALEF